MSILEIPSTGTPAHNDLGEMRFVSDHNKKQNEKFSVKLGVFL